MSILTLTSVFFFSRAVHAKFEYVKWITYESEKISKCLFFFEEKYVYEVYFNQLSFSEIRCYKPAPWKGFARLSCVENKPIKILY